MQKQTHRAGMILFFLSIFISVGNAQQSDSGSERSVALGFAYTAELFANLSGGIDTGVRYLDNIDVDAELDLERLIGLPNSTLYLYGLGNQGGSILALAGDVQGISNIEAENSWRMYEAWFQYVFEERKASVLVGLYDVNSEFDVNQTGALFINSSHGIGAAFAAGGELGPSIFPYTSAGARVKFNPVEGVTLKAAVIDGVPSDPGNTRGTKVFLRENDGALLAAELSYTPGVRAGNDPGSDNFDILSRGTQPLASSRFILGGWMYSKKRRGWLGLDERDIGVYALAESGLLKEETNDGQGLAGFLRVGLANGAINRFAGYAGTGLVYTGFFDHRNEDQFGLAVALPRSSSAYQEFSESDGAEPAGFEMNTELTYLFVFSDSVQVQIDLQYVIHPNTLKTVDNAIVTGIRTYFSF